MEFEVPRCSRRCMITDRELEPGEKYFSVLVADGDDVQRLDYSAESWEGPPENAFGWWQSKVPGINENKMHWAPNDVMLHLFERLEDKTDKQDVRYVLALLLIRRRVMREEGNCLDQQDRETMQLFCPRRESTHSVTVCEPDAGRIEEIQNELASLLFSKSL